MMGKSQKMKGSRRELEFAKLIGGQRVVLSGALKHLGEELTGDVEGLGLRWEVKARQDGFKQLYGWLSEEAVDALALKADRKDWLAVIPVKTLLKMLGREEGKIRITCSECSNTYEVYSTEDLEECPYCKDQDGDWIFTDYQNRWVEESEGQ